MILLTKLDKTRILVSLETIKYIEETPDTLVRFLNGESLIVRESIEEVSRLVDEMRRRVLLQVESIRHPEGIGHDMQLSQ